MQDILQPMYVFMVYKVVNRVDAKGLKYLQTSQKQAKLKTASIGQFNKQFFFFSFLFPNYHKNIR